MRTFLFLILAALPACSAKPEAESASQDPESSLSPTRFRRDATVSVAGMSFDVAYVITEEGSWRRFGDGEWMDNPPPPGATAQACPSVNLDLLLELAACADGLSVFVGKSRGSEDALVLRYERDGQWRGNLCINPETLLMFSASEPVYSREAQDYVQIDKLYSNYRTIDGIVVPMLIEAYIRDDLFMRIEVREMSFVSSHEEVVFALD